MLKREIVLTADGSASIRIPDWDESYHSRHGAIQEARHVFIAHGLDLFSGEVSILEMGFGTGLNALITFGHAIQRNLIVRYTGVDHYPVTNAEAALLNYPAILGHAGTFGQMHECPWQVPHALAPNFTLTKRNENFDDVRFSAEFDLVYFDAFAYRLQPNLWSEAIFTAMYEALRPGGLLVTYAARTAIRRNMEAAGFIVGKLPGPPGKREMLRARKPI